jgi:hypothetical protein
LQSQFLNLIVVVLQRLCKWFLKQKLCDALNYFSKHSDIPDYPFAKNAKEFSFATLYGKQEVLKTMPKIRAECDKLLLNGIYTTNFTKIVKMDEFEQMQMQSITSIKTFLRDRYKFLIALS